MAGSGYALSMDSKSKPWVPYTDGIVRDRREIADHISASERVESSHDARGTIEGMDPKAQDAPAPTELAVDRIVADHAARGNRRRLDYLNGQVTSAILNAEHLPPGTPSARSAFQHVSEIEESIARCTTPRSLEGEIARLGAVQAALSAGLRPRANDLVKRYRAEDIRPELSAGLEQLLAEERA